MLSSALCQSVAEAPAAGSAPAAAAPPTTQDASMPAGVRVFYASHSLMWDMPPVLAEAVEAYGIKGHTIVGHQRIGVSRTVQHWNMPDAQNAAKRALEAGNVDVFVTSNLVHPDEGITNFVKLGLERNPKMKFLMQVSWPGLGYTDNEQFNQPGGLGDGRGAGAGRGGAGPATAPGTQGAGAAAAPRGPRGRGGLGARGGGMFLSGNDEKTPEELARINATDIKNAEDQARMLNERFGKGRTIVLLVPTAQAHNALRTLIYRKEMPGMSAKSEVFIDPIGHPTAPVIALNAYLHFAVLYQRTPVGLPMPSILKNASRPEWRNEQLNTKLQELAWDVVNHYPPSGVTRGGRQEAR